MKRSIWMAAPLALGLLVASGCNIIDDNAQYIAPYAAEIVLLDVPADQLADYGVTAPDTVSLMVAIGHLTNPSSPSSSSPAARPAMASTSVANDWADGR